MQTPLNVVGLVIFVIGWLVPGHFPPWTSFQQQWFAAFGVCWMALAAATGRGTWRWPAVAVGLLALAGVPWLQWVAGQVVFLSDAALPSLYIAAFALTIAAAANLAAGEPTRWTDSLMIALLIAALASTALALMQWLQWPVSVFLLDPLPSGGRPYGNLSQPNHLATLLGLGLAANIYLFERVRLGPAVAAAVAIWLGFGLLMTQSRTAWLFLGLVPVWWFAGRRYLRLRWQPMLAGLAIFAFGVWIWPTLNEVLLLAQPQASLGARADSETRFGVWRALVEAIGDAPWFGWGWNQVPVAQLSVAFEHDAGHRAFHNAHNLLLDLAIWVGLPFALLIVSLASYWLIRQARRCDDGARWALLLAIGAIGVHAMTEYPLNYAYFLLTLGLLVGTLQGVAPVGKSWSAPRVSFVLPWTACVGMLLWTGMEYMKVEESTRDIRLLLSGVGIDKVSHVPPPQTKLLDAWREYHRYRITPLRRGMSQDEMTWVRNVAQRHPYPSTLVRYALATGLNGHAEESLRVLRAICNLHDPKSCDQARDLWRSAQQQYPELVAIKMP